MTWPTTAITQATSSLCANLSTARGPDRLRLARGTTKYVREVLENCSGQEVPVEAVRELLAALEAAHRQVGA